MSNLTGADDQPQPLTLQSEGDRSSGYTPAMARSMAEFDHARTVLSETPQPLCDVGELAALVNALPPEMGFRIGTKQMVPAGAHPVTWITTVVPSIIALSDPVYPAGRDFGEPERYDLTPGLELTEWLVPDSDDGAGEPHAADPYHRLREACDSEGPDGILSAASSAIASIGALLDDPEEGPLCYLPDDSDVRSGIRATIDTIMAIAADLSVLAKETEAEEDERNRSES